MSNKGKALGLSRIVYGFVLAASTVLLPTPVSAGVYAYSEVGVSSDSGHIYLSATGAAFSDDPEPGVYVYATLYDPWNNLLAANYAGSSGWEVVVFGDNVALDAYSSEGTYNAKAIGAGSSSGYACSPFAPVQIAAYRHHYDFSAMGNPNTYSLNEDSYNRACSHIAMTWDPTHLGGITDSGVFAHFFTQPVACLSVCAGGKNGSASGPGGNTLAAASCGS